MNSSTSISKKAPGLTWSARLLLAVSDLKHRRITVLLNVLAGAVAAIYILTPGFYARQMYRDQRRAAEESMPLKVVAAVPDVQKSEMRFTTARLAELRGLPGVANSQAAIEVGCSASVDGTRMFEVPAEGTTSADPTLSAPRLAYGRAMSPGKREAVLALPLFERMGGRFDGTVPKPAKLIVEVRRTHLGKAQPNRQELQIVGLLHAHNPDKIFVPLELADQLNLWCGSKMDETDGKRGNERPCDACWAYVPAEYDSRMAAEAASLQVDAKRIDSFEWLDASGPIWASVKAAEHHETMESLRDRMGHLGLTPWPVTCSRIGELTEELANLVNWVKPTIFAARPALEMEAAAVDGTALRVLASDPTDPAQFAAGLVRGRWLGEELDIIVPAGSAAADGAHTQVVFKREGIGIAEMLPLTFRVVGVSQLPTPHVNLSLLNKVRDWQRGTLEYDARHQRFESPVNVSRRSGTVRAAFFATNEESVETVVRGLQRLGYRTEDQLSALQGLHQLGKSLLGAVTIILFGSLFSGALCVLLTSLLNLRQKTYEVGILRANGASRADVLAIFLIQATALGLASFTLGALLTLLEPVARPMLCQLIALKPDALRGSPLLIWWLPASALAVCVATSLLAAVVPAWLVCRMAPVDLLRQRDGG